MPHPLFVCTIGLVATAAAAAQSGWALITPAQSPSVRGFHNLAYDFGRFVTVLFGGWDNTYFGDTWEYDGTTWTQRTPATAPSPRLAHAMAFDIGRGRVVLFGGAVGGGSGVDNDETWEWDGNNWLQLQSAVRPSPRRGVDMTYDVTRGVCVLFGGGFTASGITVYDDTWEWDGATWTLRNPAVRPPARWNSFLVSDWARGNVVMFGGGVGVQLMLGDTWIWDGTNWQQHSPMVHPTARRYGGAVYDIQRSLVVTWGGLMGPVGNNQTWVWDGIDWRQDPRMPRPTGRWATAAAYDFLRGRTVLFGGTTPTVLGDTWEYEASPPATWALGGTGCAGAAGIPTLAAQGGAQPVLGTTWTLAIGYGTGNGIAALALGASNQTWIGGALPQSLAVFGAPGCTLYTSTDLLSLVVLANGNGVLPWSLPSSASLAGFPFFAQALVLEASANPFGGIMSNAIVGVVGPY